MSFYKEVYKILHPRPYYKPPPQQKTHLMLSQDEYIQEKTHTFTKRRERQFQGSFSSRLWRESNSVRVESGQGCLVHGRYLSTSMCSTTRNMNEQPIKYQRYEQSKSNLSRTARTDKCL